MTKYLPLLLLLACGHHVDVLPGALSDDARDSLVVRKAQLSTWVQHCDKVPGLSYPRADYNSDANDCGDGDGVFWNGFLCLSGEGNACHMVRESVGKDGRPWRSPYRVENDSQNSYSRDQFNGLLAYIVATRDTELATRVQLYLERNNSLLCPDATDSRCNVNSIQRGLMGYVWRYIGLQPDDMMKGGMTSLSNTIKVEVNFNSPGFELHLIMQQIFLLQKTGDYDSTLQSAAVIARNKDDNNPFYHLVADGATDQGANLILDQAPIAKPDQATQWSIMRATSEEAWKQSMGWEFVMLTNFFLGAQ